MVLVAIIAGVLACTDADIASRQGSPLDFLPDNIRLLHPEGMRADWSGDGTRLLFLDALVGDVQEIDIATGNVRALTKHFKHAGFTRARYLANDDILLCGPEKNTGEDAGRWNSVMWYLAASLDQPAVPLNAICHEGPAVARHSMRVAWTESDYPNKVAFGKSELWIGDLDLQSGQPALLNRRKIIDRSSFYYLAFLETQDFRPPDETELLFTAYAWRNGEVMGIDLDNGELANYSKDWGYDEAEGVFADGRSVTVEREPNNYTPVPKGDIDIWQLPLDGEGKFKRLTRFTDFEGFGASNPVISPDGKTMAFQLRIKGGDHGNGAGLLLYKMTQ